MVHSTLHFLKIKGIGRLDENGGLPLNFPIGSLQDQFCRKWEFRPPNHCTNATDVIQFSPCSI